MSLDGSSFYPRAPDGTLASCTTTSLFYVIQSKNAFLIRQRPKNERKRMQRYKQFTTPPNI